MMSIYVTINADPEEVAWLLPARDRRGAASADAKVRRAVLDKLEKAVSEKVELALQEKNEQAERRRNKRQALFMALGSASGILIAKVIEGLLRILLTAL